MNRTKLFFSALAGISLAALSALTCAAQQNASGAGPQLLLLDGSMRAMQGIQLLGEIKKGDPLPKPLAYDVTYTISEGSAQIEADGTTVMASAGASFALKREASGLKVTSSGVVPLEVRTATAHSVFLDENSSALFVYSGKGVTITLNTGRAMLRDMIGGKPQKLQPGGQVYVERVERPVDSVEETVIRRTVDTPKPFRATASAAIGHDDNLDLAPSAQRASWLSTLNAGMSLNHKGQGLLDLGLDYDITSLKYFTASDQDAVWHHLKGFTETSFSGTGLLSFHDTYKATTELETDEMRQNTKRTQNNLDLTARLPLYNEKYGVLAAFGAENHNYFDSAFAAQDRHNKTFGGGFYAAVGKDTFIELSYLRGKLDYINFSPYNGKTNTVSLAAKGVTFESCDLTASLAYENRNYDNALGQAEDSANSILGAARLRWFPNDALTIAFTFDRKNVASYYMTNRYFTANTGSAQWTLKSGDLESSISAGFTANRYPQIDSALGRRTDTIARLGASAAYSFKEWIKGLAGYEYASSASTHPNLGYASNIVKLGVEATF